MINNDTENNKDKSNCKREQSYTKEEFKKLLVEYNIPKPYIKVNIYDRIWKQFEE